MLTRTFSLYKNSVGGLSRSIWLLSFITFINRSGTMVIPFLTIYMTKVQGFTLGQAGLGMTIFGVGSVAGSWLGGWLTDKKGYYSVQFWSLFLGGMLFILLGYVEGIYQIWMMIFILSVIAESFRPATMSAVAAYSTPENRTRSFSLLRMSINFGWSFGPAVGGWLAAVYSYHALFWVDGLTCIAAAFLMRLFLKPKKITKTIEEQTVTSKLLPVKISAYKDKKFLLFIFFNLLGAVAFMQFLSTLPVYYERGLGLSEGWIGFLLAFNGLLVVILEMPMVYVLERKFSKLACVGYGIAFYMVAYFMLNLPGNVLFIAIVSMAFLSVGEILNMPFANAYANERANDQNRGQYMGLYTMSFSVALIISPSMGMNVAEQWGFDVLWYILGSICLVAYVGVHLMKNKDLKTSDPQDLALSDVLQDDGLPEEADAVVEAR